MLSVIAFLVILAPLVVVHELGHFFFARLFNVRADAFSIGFGPRIWSRQIGETEWRVSAIPLGGYVKLFGEDPTAAAEESKLSPELQARALNRQAPWKRFFIFFGGPLFNFLWAILVFAAILAIGEPQISSVVGRVVPGSAAEVTGLRSGDRVVKVDGKDITKFEELHSSILESPGKALKLTVMRDGQPTLFTVTPTEQDGFSVYGEATHVGEVDGLLPHGRATQVGVSDPKSVAAQAGFKTGDWIETFNGQPVSNWEDLELAYSRAPAGSALAFGLKGGESRTLAKPAAVAAADGLGEAFGLRSSELFIQQVVDGAPAKAVGIVAGDRIVTVGGHPIRSFFGLKDAIQRAGEKVGKVAVTWERAGQAMSAEITPSERISRDALLKKTAQYTIGISPMLALAEPETVIERTLNPFKLVYLATERMVVLTYRNFVSIGKMFTGEVSMATLGGPIMIGKIAGESIERGLIAFLSTMALLSIGLGVLNILPIPVLDGGHILLLGVEAVRGRPLSLRQMEIIQSVGLSFILLLMVVVFKNDIMRLPIFN